MGGACFAYDFEWFACKDFACFVNYDNIHSNSECRMCSLLSVNRLKKIWWTVGAAWEFDGKQVDEFGIDLVLQPFLTVIFEDFLSLNYRSDVANDDGRVRDFFLYGF